MAIPPIDPLIWLTLGQAGGSLLGGLLAGGQERQSFQGSGADPAGRLEQGFGLLESLGPHAENLLNMDLSLPPVQTPVGFRGGGLPFDIGLTGTDVGAPPALMRRSPSPSDGLNTDTGLMPPFRRGPTHRNVVGGGGPLPADMGENTPPVDTGDQQNFPGAEVNPFDPDLPPNEGGDNPDGSPPENQPQTLADRQQAEAALELILNPEDPNARLR